MKICSHKKMKKCSRIGEEFMSAFLPEDLVFSLILPRLPPKCLMRFKCVSKGWMSRIASDSKFIDAHLRQRNRDDEDLQVLFRIREDALGRKGTILDMSLRANEGPIGRQRITVLSDQCSTALVTEVDTSYLAVENGFFDIVGSCDGLLCVEEFPSHVMWLWNPATRQRRQLPEVPLMKDSVPAGLGFGLDATSGDYKVVVLSTGSGLANGALKNETLLPAHVFSKSGAVWRSGEAIGIEGLVEKKKAVAANGALHWVLLDKGVLSFDLRNEVLKLVDGPPSCDQFRLCRWRSSLAAFVYDELNGQKSQLWTATYSDDGSICWRLIVKLSGSIRGWFRWVWKEQLVVVKRHCRGLMIALVDPENPSRWCYLEQTGPFGSAPPFYIYDYVETIVSVF